MDKDNKKHKMFCIDCDTPADKYCKICGSPLCDKCHKRSDGICESCETDEYE